MIISLLFIPAYFQGELLTAYELLARRFGAATKHFAASLFLVMRALAEGVRVFAASLVLAAVIGASLPGLPHLWLWSIVLVGLLTLIYTFEGGIAAVIWTDLIQLVIYIGGSLLAAWQLLHLVPGGWPVIAAHAEAANKFQLFSFSWDLSLPFTFWAGLVGGTFLTMASHGTDQLLVQRLLTCKNQRDSQKALITSGFIVLFQFALFLTIGVMLYAYYQHFPLPTLTSNDEIFPVFIVSSPAARHRRPGDRGGVRRGDVEPERVAQLAGVHDGARLLQAAARPASGATRDLLRLSRWCTAAWGLVLIAHRHRGARLGVGVHGRACRSPRWSTARCWARSCSASSRRAPTRRA